MAAKVQLRKSEKRKKEPVINIRQRDKHRSNNLKISTKVPTAEEMEKWFGSPPKKVEKNTWRDPDSTKFF